MSACTLWTALVCGLGLKKTLSMESLLWDAPRFSIVIHDTEYKNTPSPPLLVLPVNKHNEELWLMGGTLTIDITDYHFLERDAWRAHVLSVLGGVSRKMMSQKQRQTTWCHRDTASINPWTYQHSAPNSAPNSSPTHSQLSCLITSNKTLAWLSSNEHRTLHWLMNCLFVQFEFHTSMVWESCKHV